jgi:hypothetical protein
MGAVNRADYDTASYDFKKRACKWWKNVFWVLHMAMVKSFVICNLQQKEQNMKPLKHLKYRK